MGNPYPSSYDPYQSRTANQAYQWVGYAVAISQGCAHKAVENERLKALMTQKQATADAYSHMLPHGGATFVLDQTGRWIKLLNREIEGALHATPQPPYKRTPFFIIMPKETGTPLT